MIKLLILTLLSFLSTTAIAQQNIEDLTVAKFKVVTVKIGSKPCPIMTQTQRDATPATTGDCVYNSTTLSPNQYNGTIWKEMGGAGGISNWITATAYKTNDVVIQSLKIYQALSDHTSGVFATDLAGGKWVEVSAGITSSGSIADNRLVRYDGTTGAIIQSSSATLDDSGNLTGINNLNAAGNFTLIGDATFKTSLTGLAKLASGVLSASALVNADVDPAAAIALSKLGLLSGYVSGAGTVSSSDSVLSAIQKLDGNVTLKAPALLTGYTSGAGTVAGTDTVLQAIQKLNGNDALNQPMATLTAKGGTYAATGAGVVVQHPTGANGEIAVYDSSNAHGIVNQKQGLIDTESAFQFTGIEDLAFNWTSGNNATYFAGVAALGGTFAKDCTTPISNKCSYVYTQASGSLNDWIATGLQLVTPRYRAPNTVYFTFSYSYDGGSGDIVPVLYNAAGSAIMEMTAIKAMGATNGAVFKAVYAVSVPSTQSTLLLGFHTKALNSGKILKFNDVKLTTSLADLGIVNNTNFTDPAPCTFSTLAWSGFGTVINNLTCSRVGGELRITGSFQVGIVTGSIATLPLPTNFGSINIIPSLSNVTAGSWFRSASAVDHGGTVLAASATSTSSLYFSSVSVFGASARAALNGALATDVIGGSEILSVNISYPIQGWGVGNAQVASSNQTTLSDSMTYAFKATAIVAGDPVGTINTWQFVSNNSNAMTMCGVAPTQSLASMTTNGVLVTARAYSQTQNCTAPPRFAIKIGKDLRATEVYGYFSTGKTIPFSWQGVSYGAVEYGTTVTYEPNTGILEINGGVGNSSSNTSRFLGQDTTGANNISSGYFVFNASTQPTVSVIPITSSIGEVLTMATANCPLWTISANGAAVSRTTYAALFSALGITHGQGDGSTTFNVPDYRGRLLRGVDGTAGNDPDKASRTAMGTGGNTGNNVGSVQADQVISHDHNVGQMILDSVKVGAGAGNMGYASRAGISSVNSSSYLYGGTETRPKNAYVNYCIRYENKPM